MKKTGFFWILLSLLHLLVLTPNVNTDPYNMTTEAINASVTVVLITSQVGTTDGLPTTEMETITALPYMSTSKGETTIQPKFTTEGETTPEMASTTKGNVTTEMAATPEGDTTTEREMTTEMASTSEVDTTTEREMTTEMVSTSEGDTTTEREMTTEMVSTSEGDTTTEREMTTEGTSTSEGKTTTENTPNKEETTFGAASTIKVNLTTEGVATTEDKMTTKGMSTTDRATTNLVKTTPKITTEDKTTSPATTTVMDKATTTEVRTTEQQLIFTNDEIFTSEKASSVGFTTAISTAETTAEVTASEGASTQTISPLVETTTPTTLPITTKVASTVDTTTPSTVATTAPSAVDTTTPSTVDTTILLTVATTIPSTVATTTPSTVAPTTSSTVATTIPSTVATTIPSTVATTIPSTVATTIPSTVVTTTHATTAPTTKITSTLDADTASTVAPTTTIPTTALTTTGAKTTASVTTNASVFETTTPLPPPLDKEINVKIEFTELTFEPSLNDPNSQEYKQLEMGVIEAIEPIYEDVESFDKVMVNQFLNGSVIPVVSIIFTNSLDEAQRNSELDKLFEAIKDNDRTLAGHFVGTLEVLTSQEGQVEYVPLPCEIVDCPEDITCTNGATTCMILCEENPNYCLNDGDCSEVENDGSPNIECTCPGGFSGNQCQNEHSGLPTATLVGIIVGTVGGVILITVVVIVILLRRPRDKTTPPLLSPRERIPGDGRPWGPMIYNQEVPSEISAGVGERNAVYQELEAFRRGKSTRDPYYVEPENVPHPSSRNGRLPNLPPRGDIPEPDYMDPMDLKNRDYIEPLVNAGNYQEPGPRSPNTHNYVSLEPDGRDHIYTYVGMPEAVQGRGSRKPASGLASAPISYKQRSTSREAIGLDNFSYGRASNRQREDFQLRRAGQTSSNPLSVEYMP